MPLPILFLFSHSEIIGKIVANNLANRFLLLFGQAIFDNVQNERAFFGNNCGGTSDIFDKIQINRFMFFYAVRGDNIVMFGDYLLCISPSAA